MDLFDFSTDEPPYDAFDISSCSAPDDFYTMILIIPGQESGIDFGQLRRNICTSVTNYTGLRPLQIGNIQVSGLCSTMSIGYCMLYTNTCTHIIILSHIHTYNAQTIVTHTCTMIHSLSYTHTHSYQIVTKNGTHIFVTFHQPDQPYKDRPGNNRHCPTGRGLHH